MIYGMRFAAMTTADERFGKGKIVMFDMLNVRAQTWTKIVRFAQYHHPLFSVAYVLPRDYYGRIPRTKWLITINSFIMSVCVLTSQNATTCLFPTCVTY